MFEIGVTQIANIGSARWFMLDVLLFTIRLCVLPFLGIWLETSIVYHSGTNGKIHWYTHLSTDSDALQIIRLGKLATFPSPHKRCTRTFRSVVSRITSVFQFKSGNFECMLPLCEWVLNRCCPKIIIAIITIAYGRPFSSSLRLSQISLVVHTAPLLHRFRMFDICHTEYGDNFTRFCSCSLHSC